MLKILFIKFKNYKIRNLYGASARSGQSLIEILIALAIGAILIGAATLGIAFMIRSTATNERLQAATGLARDSIEKLRSWSSSDWQNIYMLQKGTTTKYFLVPSSTTFAAVLGEEGALDNEVRVGLVGKWGFDEATGTIAYDSTGGGSNGILTNNPTRATSSQCTLGGCLVFNSGIQTLVSVTSTSALNPSSITIMMRIKFDSIPYTSQIVLNKEGQYSLMAADINPSKVSLRYATTQVGWDAGTLVGTTTLVANTWYHVAATFDGRQWTLYLNGNFENSTTIATSTLVSGTGDLNIGAYASGSYHFNGAIDDVRIYNRALSAAEIKNLYQSKLFNRYFTIQNVCRKIGETNIVPASSTSCAGDYFEDPSTQQASIFVEWPAVGNVGQLKLVEYITRWRNEILHEQNWNGGGDQEGPITVPNGKFATSSNIDIDSYGVIKVRPQ